MGRTFVRIPAVLLTLTFLTVTQAQYYDVLQGFQQLFQPFQQQNDYITQYNDVNNNNRQVSPQRQTNRQENKKKQETERYINSAPVNQYDYVFSTSTTPKPSRKSTKPNSSHSNKSNRHFNTDFNFHFNDFFTQPEITTKRTRVNTNNKKTTTVRPNSRPTTNDFGMITFDNRGPEKVFDNSNRNVYSVNTNTHENLYDNSQGNRRPDNSDANYNRVIFNSRNPNVQNVSPDQNRGNNYDRPTNSRNPDVLAINTPGVTHNNRQKFAPTTSGFINTNHNRGNSYDRDANNRVITNNFSNQNNRGILNTDYDGDSNGGIIYPGNPLINRPGVKPAPVDVNQPPITNKPVTKKNNFLPYDRPPDDGYGFTERPVDSPEILIGPDEDDMTEGQKRRYINMAERMCDRYKNLNVKELVALPLLPSPDPVEVNVSSCVPITSPLVIGGKVASINEFPHMALIGWRKKQDYGYSWKCGGSLISDRYILTAGHCTYQERDYDADSGPPQAVQLGSSNLDDPGALVVKISAVVRHPKFKQRRSYYDIALIKMAQVVTFSEVIRPACLGVPPPVGNHIIATGWGRTEFGGDHSQELRTVSLPVWNMGDCREIWGTSLKLPNGPTPDSHVCAGDKRGGKDTCQGDSGGPAQIQDGCVWRVVAVTSVGRSCGAPNTPALYALVKRAFIAAQIFGEEETNQNTQNYDNRRPSFNDRSQGFEQPSFFVNNFRRQ